MWLYILFGAVLFIGLMVSIFILYEWYQALGIIILCLGGSIVMNLLGIEFEWCSYILGYLLCLISHIKVKKE